MADAGLTRICASAALLERGDGVRFRLAEGGLEREAFVVRYRGRAVAYLNRCAHAGLELDWLPGRFLDGDGDRLICAAHGALYDPASGGCADGPCAGRGGLVPVEVVEVEGAVYWRRSGSASA